MNFGVIACGIALGFRCTFAQTQSDALSLVQTASVENTSPRWNTPAPTWPTPAPTWPTPAPTWGASDIECTIDLRKAAYRPCPSLFIHFVVTPEDSNNDTWFETVLKINVGDPALKNPYDVVEFEIKYDGPPTGMSVNIGDSSTNNGFSGDAGTQSNDAEMQVGSRIDLPLGDIAYDDLTIWGKDASRPDTNLGHIHGIVSQGSTLHVIVKDEYLQWNNGDGTCDELSSPFLYALDGQPDSEGPVNYDIFAAFNRVILSNERIGSGVGTVTIRLRDVVH